MFVRKYIQWNLSNTDTLGTKIIILISEVSFFQGENNMYLYKVGIQSSVLIKQDVLKSQRCPLREVPLYMCQPRIEIEHYSVVYFHHITVFEVL